MESHWYYYNILQRAWATFAWWASPLTATSRSLIAHMKVSWNQRNIIQALSSISVRCQSWHTRWPWHFCLHVIAHCFSRENDIYIYIYILQAVTMSMSSRTLRPRQRTSQNKVGPKQLRKTMHAGWGYA
jgi:hypothetical protein